MDPTTLALIGAAILAGIGIKRASAPPPRFRPEDEAAPKAPSFYGIPPHAFAGGLRRPVTHRAVTESVPTEGDRGGREVPEEPPAGGLQFVASPRALEAVASSPAADVVGVSRGGGTAPTTSTGLSGTRPPAGTSIYTQPPIYSGGFGGKLATIRR